MGCSFNKEKNSDNFNSSVKKDSIEEVLLSKKDSSENKDFLEFNDSLENIEKNYDYSPCDCESKWNQIDTGLSFMNLCPKKKSSYGDSKIRILKINPEYYKFDFFSSKELSEKNKTVKEWANDKGLVAAINAGMYRGDYKTNVGFMKNYDFFNNPEMTSDNCVVAFNRKDEDVPLFQVIDLQFQNWDSLKNKYNSFAQGIRMVDSNQKNRWSYQEKMWSIAALGSDKKGNALFMFSRSPYRVHDFNNILLNSNINIKNAMYLEGGPEASFYVGHKNFNLLDFGSYETGLNEDNENSFCFPLPNIIGVKKR